MRSHQPECRVKVKSIGEKVFVLWGITCSNDRSILMCSFIYLYKRQLCVILVYLLYCFTVLEVSGADGLVSETISWMAKRSLSRWRGLLMPISRWISVSDRADMMAPLFTLARQAATYHAGIPTHSWWESSRFSALPSFAHLRHFWQEAESTDHYITFCSGCGISLTAG